MADESQAIRAINWRETFPFTHIFRAFRIAIHPSKLVLGLLLIFSLYAGGRILDAVWPSASLPNAFDIQQYEELRWLHAARSDFSNLPLPEQALYGDMTRALELARASAQGGALGPKVGISTLFFSYEVRQASAIINASYTDWGVVAHGLTNFLFIGPSWLLRFHLVYCIFFFAIFLIVWAVFGGAISRIAAVHVARDEKISLRQAVSFSTSKILSFIFAPLIPIIIILVAGVAVAFGALLFYIPYIGPVVAACFFFLALIAGFVMALVATGTLAGFNLMYPTIAVEGSDSFDAISRSFSYVFARPWRMIFYSAVALIYGALCYAFAHWFVFVMLKLAHLFAAWWLKGQPGTYFPAIWPSPDLRSLAYPPAYDSLKGADALAAGIISFWIYLVIAMLAAFVLSFYFSANTIIYTLMRAEVDATELDDVYVEETDEDFGELTTNRPSDAAAVVPLSETAPPPPAPVPAPDVVSDAPPAT